MYQLQVHVHPIFDICLNSPVEEKERVRQLSVRLDLESKRRLDLLENTVQAGTCVHVHEASISLSLECIITQVNGNLEREYIKCRRDRVEITRHNTMHQVLYNVHVTLFIG